MQFTELVSPLVVIVGPTAVGKTELSIQLAERFSGEIVSADSRQFYRGMDIGTAKATLAEQGRVPHHLLDVAEPDDIWSLAVFQQAAADKIAAIHKRGHLPFLVGGTGQYVRAVIEAWDIPAQEPDDRMRKVLEKRAAEIGPLALHDQLRIVDPQAAELIDARNVRRTIRALEVILNTGIRFSAQRQKKTSPYSLLIIGLKRDRPQLYMRVDQRIELMLQMGFIEEVRALLEKGYAPDLPTMSAIGYEEMIEYLQGRITLDEALVLMKRRTRLFIRRQANWFKLTDPNINWFDAAVIDVNELTKFINSPQNWILPGQYFSG